MIDQDKVESYIKSRDGGASPSDVIYRFGTGNARETKAVVRKLLESGRVEFGAGGRLEGVACRAKITP